MFEFAQTAQVIGFLLLIFFFIQINHRVIHEYHSDYLNLSIGICQPATNWHTSLTLNQSNTSAPAAAASGQNSHEIASQPDIHQITFSAI
ncbi:hypothetical protein XBI1_2290045 [Xenorhabdus bovienii str. Intermedium]|uniref:Uncharacterized protein n=1 Tax=Xenorhabdus bovienii str. Intermedium TaxID=1379677 RepID=A0A077QKS2_XENBV|nr:hypothetical protein XBI1_2290045 [Xenorhabdus bovienii str. Intermedium]